MARKKQSPPPSYRLHRQSGQAIVTLPCTFSGKRKDVLLGEHNSSDSWAEYARVIAEWEAAGRVLDNAPETVVLPSQITVAEVMLDWWEDLLERYNITDPAGYLPGKVSHYGSIVKVTRATCGAMRASEFGPLALQEVRRKMVARGWKRKTVNGAVAVVVRAFKRAVAQEAVRPETVTALECVRPLRRGELGAPEGRKVKPVPVEHFEAVKPYLSRQVCAIMDVMRWSGCRCDEAVKIRAIDIDTTGKVWEYRPVKHKSEYTGRERLIHIGPRAQKVVEQFMAGKAVDEYLFSPREARDEWLATRRKERVTPDGYGNVPGSNRKPNPGREPGKHYTTNSVRHAITRACDKAGVPRWTPHMIRHLASTEYRKLAGVEAAAAILDHSSPTLTDQVYAERNMKAASEIVGKVG